MRCQPLRRTLRIGQLTIARCCAGPALRWWVYKAPWLTASNSLAKSQPEAGSRL
jgi:hypothetical protein